MLARVSTATAQPGKLDEVIKVMRDSVLPATKKQKGIKGLFLLTDQKTGKGTTITLWNTETEMTASLGPARELATKMLPLVAGSPGPAETYEVSVRG